MIFKELIATGAEFSACNRRRVSQERARGDGF